MLPNVSGKIGEVLVVIDKDYWEGELGEKVRGTLADDVPFLPQKEPLFTLLNVPQAGFSNLLQVHRNIVIFDVNPQCDTAGVFYHKNVWARPQSVVQISAADVGEATRLLDENSVNIVRYIEQAERDRVIANALLYEEVSIADTLTRIFGGSPHFPKGYKLMTKTDDFAWVAYDRTYVYQDVLVYKYPVPADDPFTPEAIISKRNEVMRENVPGMFENTYMTTSEYLTPLFESMRYRGHAFVETRGLWEVANDYMGGPFVSHSFYSPDGKDIIVAEAFVYAPRYDKRQYMLQVEALLYSWEWEQKEQKSEN